MLRNIENIIGAEIKEGTIIAILDNHISSKEKHEKYFSTRWFDDNKQAENVWSELVEYIVRNHDAEIAYREYPKISRRRKELTIGGLKQ